MLKLITSAPSTTFRIQFQQTTHHTTRHSFQFYTRTCTRQIVNVKFLQYPHKWSNGNQLIHRRPIKKFIGRRPRFRQSLRKTVRRLGLLVQIGEGGRGKEKCILYLYMGAGKVCKEIDVCVSYTLHNMSSVNVFTMYVYITRLRVRWTEQVLCRFVWHS